MSRTALLIVDHGSKQAEANAKLKQVAALLEALRPGLIVRYAHMQLAPPDIAASIEACVQAGATEVVIHPYMLSPGRHATQDIPRIAAESAARHPDVKFRVTDPLGLDRKIAEVVLERADL